MIVLVQTKVSYGARSIFETSNEESEGPIAGSNHCAVCERSPKKSPVMHSYQCGRVGNGTIRSFFMVIKLKSFRLTFSAVKISHKRTVRWVLEFIYEAA